MIRTLLLATLIATLPASALLTTATASPCTQESKPVERAELGGTRNVHACGDLFFAGQFSPEDISKLREAGIRRVITLRTDGEIEWDEKAAVEKAGIEFVALPFRAPETLTDQVFDELRKLLADQGTKTLLHCGSANRVGGAWIPFRVLDQGVSLEKAREEAQEIGLRNAGYEQRAIEYIEKRRAEEAARPKSVKPGINDSFLAADLDVKAFIDRFEGERREVSAARAEVLAACRLKPGQRVADVGSGTGLYTRVFSKATGAEGWVFAVDIAPRFVQHLRKVAKDEGLANVTTILCAEDDVGLPPKSIDLAFVCDTYHHFEYPAQTLASIRRALVPGGHLVVIDFERIPGKSSEWILGHVRAGKDEVRAEIEAAGFELVEEVDVEGLEENYFLRFRSP